ncbi:DEAD H (Asp-Glu-Ala-Asp His) box helicase 11 [Tyrophagus putrescentiae]|nr:DEAD H (Asp-Glu-Ala-Asp His) box helicase 11 [Tyrophagus putrescentiae]
MDTNSSCRDYEFPYEPYRIQLQLMDKIYESIEEKKVAIIESPTGTGKSLSIICSALKWIEDHRANQINQLTKEIENMKLSCSNADSSLDWVEAQSKKISVNLKIKDHDETLDKINKHVTYSKELKKRAKMRRLREVAAAESKSITTKRQSDYDMFDEENELIVKYCDTEELLDEVDDEKKWDNFYKPKIYYCSRTHSQLSQFINEVKKTKKYHNEHNSLMLVPLSSRVNYCVNPDVNRFSNVNVINEKCKELMNGKKKCCMNQPSLTQQLNEEILGNVQDLEDIVTKAKQLKACPYYASRSTLTEAEIVIMPYNILLHKGTRDSFGIHLKDSVIIIDEAHNLLETLANVYSIEIRQRHLEMLQTLLTKYMTKYYSRFNPLNLMYLKQLIFIVKRLQLSLKALAGDKRSYNPLEFVLKLEIERINIYKLAEFIDKSHIASKLYMFSLKPPSEEVIKKTKISGTLAFLNKVKSGPATKKDKEVTPATNSKEQPKEVANGGDNDLPQESFNSNMLYTLKELLFALKDYSVEGKVLLTINQETPADSTCKYILLNSSTHFKEIIEDCRSVILCGGTMKPFEDYINQLFKPLNISNNRILTFSCEHVIEKDHLIAIGCGRGPNNAELNFTYSSRSLPKTIDETGQAVLKYCQAIPKGVVVFFPSYDYEDLVLKQWQQSGILKRIESCKRVFKEPRKATLTAAVLNGYTRVNKASQSNGAVLFSVIGGKMSEGINFSDDLGRGVIVLGLPYANKNSVELQEKMAFLERSSAGLANEYYENLCMRAVNQSIGRAIRHKDDYAAIILLDSRYCTKTSVKTKLSDWIKNRYTTCDNFNMSLSQVQQFFKNKK